MWSKVLAVSLFISPLASIVPVAAGSKITARSDLIQQDSIATKQDGHFSTEELSNEDNSNAFQEYFNDGVISFDDRFFMDDFEEDEEPQDPKEFGEAVPVTDVPVSSISGNTSPIKGLSTLDSPAGAPSVYPTIEPTKISEEPSANSTPVEAQPALSELAGEEKTPELIEKICRSREFQPTITNYWVSGADEWLKAYTVENQNEQAFVSRGLAGSIAEKYLGCNGFYQGDHGGFPQNSCPVTCFGVVERIDNIQEARKVLFVLTSIAGLAEKASIIYNAISDIPQSVAKLVNGMPSEEWHDTPSKEADAIISEAVNMAMLAASPSVPPEKMLEDGYYTLQAAKYYYDQAVQASDQASKGNDPFKYDKAFDSEYEPSLVDLDFVYKGYSDTTENAPEGMPKDSPLGRAVSRYKSLLEDARAFAMALGEGDLNIARAEGFKTLERVLEINPSPSGRKQGEVAGAGGILGDAAARGMNKLGNAFIALLRGDSSSIDGTTDLSTVLRYGHYLPSGSAESIFDFKKALIGTKIAREVFMRLFNNSLRKKMVYISCTRDIQARSCSSDRSGPQDLKACLPSGYVCYMYEWKDRSPRNRSRNKKPVGSENWSEKPWSIDAQDIITSSFNNHMKMGPVDDLPTLATLGEAKASTSFNIPVCISDHNWNTQLGGWNTLCDTDINCPAKSLPCNCGAWGMDTLSVWKDIGLMSSPNHDYLSATVCPRQIRKKIPDPLERYVAYCNLDIRRGSSGSRVDGSRRYQGRDRYCDVITGTLESMPKNPRTQELPRSVQLDKLDPSMKFTFLCHIQKGGRGCQMYKKEFDDIWRNWQGANPAAGEITTDRSGEERDVEKRVEWEGEAEK